MFIYLYNRNVVKYINHEANLHKWRTQMLMHQQNALSFQTNK